MDLRSFYEALLPSRGAFALFHVPTRRHLWFDSLDALVHGTEQVAGQHSWYFATAGFSSHARTQVSVLAKRCLYLDIDAGPEKYERDPANSYPTQRDALAALVEFAKAVRLAPSIVVSSGAGVHAYWALDADADPLDWTVAAEQLKAAAKAFGLKADPTCTADSARVLRPVGALHKNGNTVTVLLANGKTWGLEVIRATLPPVAAPVRREVARDINDDVLGTYEGPPVSAVKIAEHCPALAYVANKRGDVPEPLWRAMIGVVKHTVEGADQAHAWSDGYAGYSFDETQEKYDRYGAGPTTCAKFEEYTDACVTCPHRGQLKSPIVLGKMTPKQVEKLPPELKPLDPEPDPKFGKDFREELRAGKPVLSYRKVTKDEDPEGNDTFSASWQVLSHTVFWFDEWTEAGAGENENARSRLVIKTGKRLDAIDFEDWLVADRKAMLKFLASKNIRPASFDAPTQAAMQTYVNEQLQRIREAAARPVLRDRFGFQFDRRGKFVYAQGEHVIYEDGTIRRALLGGDMVIHRGFGQIRPLPDNEVGVWDKAVWNTTLIPAARKQVEFLQRWYGSEQFAVAQLAIMAHLAAPMMCFTANSIMEPDHPLPPVGATVSLYSANSGRGKTTAMQAAASAFGPPEVMVHRGGKGGITKVAASARVAMLGTGAFDLDEVTRDVAEDAAELIDNIASGTDKMRGNQKGRVARAPATFSVIGFVSTNMPQRDLLASVQTNSDALQQRLVELNFDAQPAISREAFTAYMSAFPVDMAPYVGSLGAFIHLACVANGPVKMHAHLNKAMIQAADMLGAEARERFSVRVLACVLHTQQVLELAGMKVFDTDSLIHQFKVAMGAGRESAAAVATTGLDQMRRMLAEISSHCIVTLGESVSSEKTDLLENHSALRMPIKGRQVKVGRYTYVGADVIRGWCKANGVSYTQMIEEARGAGVLMPMPGGTECEMHNLTKAVQGVPQVRMPCFKFSHVALYGDEKPGDNVVDLRRDAAQPKEKTA